MYKRIYYHKDIIIYFYCKFFLNNLWLSAYEPVILAGISLWNIRSPKYLLPF